MNNKNDDRNLKIVISPIIASKLCNMGFPIVKIKPKRGTNGEETSATIFLFEATKEFLDAFNNLIKDEK